MRRLNLALPLAGLLSLLIVSGTSSSLLAADAPAPSLLHDVLPLLKTRCVKCHGPAKREGALNLSTPGVLAHGGESGPAVVPGNLDVSLLWQRVAADEMPPEDPLTADEKATLQAWIVAGAPGMPEQGSVHPSGDHWAFVPLSAVEVPTLRDPAAARNDIDRFLLAELERHALTFNPEADRRTLIRRVAFDLTGLPPTPYEIETFLGDTAADAYERMVDRYLASPRYGERWGKHWLDAAGYADSNGYFNADSERPLAYRYRDYVIRSLNEDKPFDRFVIEQLAGDELAGFKPGQDASPEIISLLEATHYLRNGQDGTNESDGNPEEVKNDKYAALDACLQIVSSSLLGLTVQCAKCHDHKFEPLSHKDYYQWQSIFYPAFNIEDWVKPKDRIVQATLPGELAAWRANEKDLDERIASLEADFAAWARQNRLRGIELLRESFDEGGPPLADSWTTTAPGDDAPGGEPLVNLDVETAPAAIATGGILKLIETGHPGERWITTKQSFEWLPKQPGDWIQVTFDLVANRLEPDGTPALRVAYYVAAHDFDDSGPGDGGNLMFEGRPDAGAQVYTDYPGSDNENKGAVGTAKYEPGHNYGVRITRQADGQCLVEHLYEGLAESKSMVLPASYFTPGGFGFMLCHGRSFSIDNLLIEQSKSPPSGEDEALLAELNQRRTQLQKEIEAANQSRRSEPGMIAWSADRSATAPVVHLLERGNSTTPGEAVQPAPLSALEDPANPLEIVPPPSGSDSTGRRLAWARWVTAPGSRSAALFARVQVNRIWQQHFGTGIVATSENLGVSGAAPSHPELLNYLAHRFASSGYSLKQLHRQILASAAYRQSSQLNETAHRLDPDNRLLWRWTVRRLDAESIRDATLAVADSLDVRMGGPYVPTRRDQAGEVVVADDAPRQRRSLYLQQRRTQTLSLLGVFDSPSIVVNCVQRPVSTIPLQSLSLLNSPFLREQAARFAERLKGPDENLAARLDRGFVIAIGRTPSDREREASLAFLESQSAHYAEDPQADQRALVDYCHMLLASSSFLYIE